MAAWGHGVTARPVEAKCQGQPAWKACPEPALWTASYRYVTGRRGRVTSWSRELCEAHARRFMARAKKPWPEPTR